MSSETKIKLNNAQVINLVGTAAQSSGVFIFQKEYSASIAFRLGQVYLQLAEYYHNVLEDKINAIYKKYGTEKDGKLVIPSINQKAFEDEQDKLMEDTVEVVFTPLTFAEIKQFNFTPFEIVALMNSGLLA